LDPGPLNTAVLAAAYSIRLVGRARAEAILDPLDRAVYAVAGPVELVAQTFAAARSPGRFHRAGEPGVWYACARLDAAVAEVAFHQRRWLAASGLAGLTVRLVEARAAFAGRFADLRGVSTPELAADITVGWPAGQVLADQARAQRLDGVIWPSVRDPARGEAYALLDRYGVRAPRWGEAWRLAIDDSSAARFPINDEPLIAPVP
jgi:hypothetical protein